jgi:hypothetical protein
VVAGDGSAELRLFFGPLSTMGFSGYLQSLAAVTQLYYSGGGIDSWDKVPAAVYSVYEGVADEYGPTVAGLWYPRELGIPIELGAQETVVEVFVPVMDAISAGSGTQLARLRIDWDGFDLTGGSGGAGADLGALQAAIADARGAAPGGISAKSYAALEASIAAGEWLAASNEALTVTQAMADSRAAAIGAAKAALFSAAADPGDPGDSEDPNDPDGTDPGDPGDPGDPNDPNDPADPSDPDGTGDPSDPDGTDPGDPDDTGDPSDPDGTDPGDPADTEDQPSQGNGDTQSPGSAVDPSRDGRYYVSVALWHGSLNQASMGNVAFDSQALVITSGGRSVIQIGTHPVEVSGYTTGITDVEGARAVSTAAFTTNTKFDGTAHAITYLRVFELGLESTSSQYLPVRIKVPYTPMDAVGAATDGWLSARLNINWQSVSAAPPTAELNPSTSVSGGSSSLDAASAPAASLADSATGIGLDAPAGAVPSGARLSAPQITSGAALARAQAALAGISGLTGNFKLYDISVTQNGSAVQLGGSVTVSIPIPAGYASAGVAAYRINDDGTATLIKGAVSGGKYQIVLSKLGAIALAEGGAEEIGDDGAPGGAAAAGRAGRAAGAADFGKFEDIDGHWAYETIREAVEGGLFVGTSETTFSPDAPMTRAMFVAVLSRIAGAGADADAGAGADADESAGTGADADESAGVGTEAGAGAGAGAAARFSDVEPGAWYASAVEWAAASGVAQGVGGGLFAPDAEITRQEMATMLAGYAAWAGVELAPAGGAAEFADGAQIADWAQEPVAALAAAGLVEGVGGGNYAPLRTATRAEAATLLARFARLLA